MLEDTNYLTYFESRSVDYEPFHFIKCTADVSHDSINWVLHNLNGRYFLHEKKYFYSNDVSYVSFEDPREAAWYDLRWS